ncbi:MAG: hypothetical protein MR594_10995, partial [Lachnospiraceae bacterium]|nr:hypothetical protein [Lachnospiraceae bacterium]
AVFSSTSYKSNCPAEQVSGRGVPVCAAFVFAGALSVCSDFGAGLAFFLVLLHFKDVLFILKFSLLFFSLVS